MKTENKIITAAIIGLLVVACGAASDTDNQEGSKGTPETPSEGVHKDESAGEGESDLPSPVVHCGVERTFPIPGIPAHYEWAAEEWVKVLPDFTYTTTQINNNGAVTEESSACDKSSALREVAQKIISAFPHTNFYQPGNKDSVFNQDACVDKISNSDATLIGSFLCRHAEGEDNFCNLTALGDNQYSCDISAE